MIPTILTNQDRMKLANEQRLMEFVKQITADLVAVYGELPDPATGAPSRDFAICTALPGQCLVSADAHYQLIMIDLVFRAMAYGGAPAPFVLASLNSSFHSFRAVAHQQRESAREVKPS